MNRNTLKQWFSNGKKPNQEQFWEWIDSFWHKDEKIPQSNVEGLNTSLNNKAEESLVQAHYVDEEAHGIKDKLAKKADVTALEKVKESIGELADLKAGDKSNVVAAINELINQYENDDRRFQGVLTIEDNRNGIGFYFAKESGKYVNAGGLEVDLTKGLYILSYDGVEWEAECVNLMTTTGGVNVDRQSISVNDKNELQVGKVVNENLRSVDIDRSFSISAIHKGMPDYTGSLVLTATESAVGLQDKETIASVGTSMLNGFSSFMRNVEINNGQLRELNLSSEGLTYRTDAKTVYTIPLTVNEISADPKTGNIDLKREMNEVLLVSPGKVKYRVSVTEDGSLITTKID